eukprot:TRINITY_DN41103_c0_g1_i2.p1 TRINITY_DN41103_c0_g1~~TRINITY_DN41103_c0_g1_i2.p1  ORF type:complete len:127 (-),score=23.51 TRINITY_DN41103_c0_g1_i2:198-578(-)
MGPPRLMRFLTVAIALLLHTAEGGKPRCMSNLPRSTLQRSFAIACIWPARDDCKNGQTTFSTHGGKTCNCPATPGTPADDDTCWTGTALMGDHNDDADGADDDDDQDDSDYYYYYYYYYRRLEMVV